jgi:preprotein translocase subunit SecB
MYIKLISFVQPNERNIPNKNFQLEITLVTEQIGIKDYNENNYKYCKGKEGN